MNLSLQGKNALVCGGSQGIGWASAVELANFGARITLFARDAARLEQAAAQLPRPFGQAHDFLTADFSEPQTVQQTAARYIQQYPDLSFQILINNSGGPKGGAITNAATEEFLAAYQQHILCSHLLAQTLLPAMKAAQYGRIINIISTSVKIPISGLGVSNTTRGAMASWAKTWANEVAAFGITVNNVLPGFTATARLHSLIEANAAKAGESTQQITKAMLSSVPAGRFGEAAEVAAAVAFLASPAAAYINGINLPVDGGRTGCL